MTASTGSRADDLTARARIRDAALAQFGEHGYRGATFKGVAAAAGVSVGLVQHHFGTKEELRAACDQAVLEVVEQKMAAVEAGRLADPGVLGALYAAGPPIMRYLARSVQDGTPAVRRLLDEVAAASARFLTANWPERFPARARRTRDAAALLVAMSLGPLVLHEQVATALELEPWADIASPRIGLATLDVYAAMGDYVSSAPGADLRRAVEKVHRRARRQGDG
jgi:AcrR family transcriptional regulator